MSSEQKIDMAAQFIDRVTNLPPAPTVAVELLGLFSDPDRDIDRIVQLITHDPSLTAEVLKRCNSAFLGGEPASDMFEAVNRLGFYEVYCMVVALVGSRALAMARKDSGLDTGALWRHAVATAVAASALAKHVGEDPAAAFTTGLLHDTGKLIFASAIPNEYSMILSEAGWHGYALAMKERELLETDHAAVGGRLLVRWGVPPIVAYAVWHHHASPMSATGCERMASVLNIANALAHCVGEQSVSIIDIAQDCQESLQYLSLTEDHVSGLMVETQEGMEHVQALLQMAI